MRKYLAALCLAAVSACGPTPSSSTPPAENAETSAATTTGWDTHLTELLPFIDACLAKSPDTRWISYAGRTGEGLVMVRMSGGAGEFDCTVPDDDPSAERALVTAHRDDLHIDGEGAAIFVRAPGENPGGACYTAPEVRDGNGVLVGWMADPEGC